MTQEKIIQVFMIGITILCISLLYLPFSSYKMPCDINVYAMDTLFNRGKELLGKKSFTEAEQYLKGALEYEQKFAPLHFYLGIVYEEMEDYERAILEYHKTTQIDKEYYKPFYKLGLLLSKTERDTDAIIAIKRAIEKNPYYIPAYKELYNLFIRTGDFESAEKVYEDLHNFGESVNLE